MSSDVVAEGDGKPRVGYTRMDGCERRDNRVSRAASIV